MKNEDGPRLYKAPVLAESCWIASYAAAAGRADATEISVFFREYEGRAFFELIGFILAPVVPYAEV